MGKEGYGFSALENCNKTVHYSHNGLLCQWNGSNYQPYFTPQNRPVGKEGYGFIALDRCVQSVQYSRFDLACNWAGASYTAYDTYTNAVIAERFLTLEACSRYIHP